MLFLHTHTRNVPSLLLGTSSTTLSFGKCAGGILPRSIKYVSLQGARLLTFSFWKKRKMEAPSMCGGTGTPAISKNVGARSTLPIRLWTTRPRPTPGPRTKNGTRMSDSNGNDLPTTFHFIISCFFFSLPLVEGCFELFQSLAPNANRSAERRNIKKKDIHQKILLTVDWQK